MKTTRQRMGRPRQFTTAMYKTSMALPQELVEALKASAKLSGFKSWAEQARYELMVSRGMWKEVTPTLPAQEAPRKA